MAAFQVALKKPLVLLFYDSKIHLYLEIYLQVAKSCQTSDLGTYFAGFETEMEIALGSISLT